MDPVKLGYIVNDKDAARDAVHVAVIPVTAACSLDPGQHVGRWEGDKFGIPCDKPMGIVDPYLTERVNPGERFWLFLYPYSVKGVRHAWEHPDFPAEATPAAISTHEAMLGASVWLRNFANEWGMSYNDMVEGAKAGDGIAAYDRDIHSWDEIAPADQKKFWDCLEIVTGQTFSAEHRKNTYFSCSC